MPAISHGPNVSGGAQLRSASRRDFLRSIDHPWFSGSPKSGSDGWFRPTRWLRRAGAAAQELRDKAYEAAPAVSGKINDTPFEWIADADSRLGPMLEAVVNGKYYWVPLSAIHELLIEAPSDLRDLVWIPANFTWTNGGQVGWLIPTRYPGSEKVTTVRFGWRERPIGLNATVAGSSDLVSVCGPLTTRITRCWRHVRSPLTTRLRRERPGGGKWVS